jgi:hypothetical protein
VLYFFIQGNYKNHNSHITILKLLQIGNLMSQKQQFTASFLTLIFCLFSNLSYGSGAYVVDDGGIVGKDTLQIENWYNQSSQGEQLFTTNPTYQLLPNAEFAMQMTYDKGIAAQSILMPQIKYLWHDSDKVASSAVIGINYRTNRNGGIFGSFFYIPTTIKVNESLNLHVDIGVQNWDDVLVQTNLLIGGVSAEVTITKKSSLIFEIFRNSNKHQLEIGNNFSSRAITGTQIGWRNFYSKNLVLDVIYGKDITGAVAADWITAGVTLLF